MAAKAAPRCCGLLGLEPAGARLTTSHMIEDLQQARELAIEKGDASATLRRPATLAEEPTMHSHSKRTSQWGQVR